MYDITSLNTHTVCTLPLRHGFTVWQTCKKHRSLSTDKVFLTLPLAVGAFGFVGTGSSWTGFTGTGFSGSLKVHIGYLMLDFRT